MKKILTTVGIITLNLLLLVSLGIGFLLIAIWSVKNLEIYRIAKMFFIPIMIYIGICLLMTAIEIITNGIKIIRKQKVKK